MKSRRSGSLGGAALAAKEAFVGAALAAIRVAGKQAPMKGR